MKQHNYFVYIVTNHVRSTLYVGVTNDISRRLQEHFENRGDKKTFAGRYHCYKLVYYERFQIIDQAIARETEIKAWSRQKKDALINTTNPRWDFLNEEVSS